MMDRLRYYTSESVEVLRSSIERHLEWYYSGNGMAPMPSVSGGFRATKVVAPLLDKKLETEEQNPESKDALNSLAVYSALESLSAHQASMERMWVWLCHNDCPEYVRARWLKDRPSSEQEAVRRVVNHFFARGNRGLIRDNGVSRLWWLGRVAHDAAPDNPRKFLDILLHRQDVRSALIERPSVSMNRTVLRVVFRVMEEFWDGDKSLFVRERFRDWMVALNRRGGVVLLDAIPERALYQLVRGEAAAYS